MPLIIPFNLFVITQHVGTIKYKNFYEIGLEKYPYNVIYTMDDINKIVTVIAIYHHKRNPRKKFKKK